MTRFACLILVLAVGAPALADDAQAALALAAARRAAGKVEPKAAPCVCGDDCKCLPGSCPGACPVAATPRQATVRVAAGNGAGTGAVIASENGRSLVLTNSHVVDNHRSGVTVTWWEGEKLYVTEATVLYTAPVRQIGPSLIAIDGPDVALLMVGHVLPAAKLAGDLPAVGDRVEQFGYGGMSGPVSYTAKHKVGSVLGSAWDNGPELVTSIHSESGDSGSGVWNARGELVGLTAGNDSHGRHRGPALPLVTAVIGRHAAGFPSLCRQAESCKAEKAACKPGKATPANPFTLPGSPCPSGRCPNAR